MSVINYYTSGITANGYVSYLKENLDGIEKTIYVTGEADYSALNEYILQFWSKQNNRLEYIHNAFMNFPYEAIINVTAKTAVVFNINPYSPPHCLSENTQVLDLNKYKDDDIYKKYRNILLGLYQNRQACLQSAYLYFARGLRVHDEWEKIYVGNLDFNKMGFLTRELCQKIVGDNRSDRGMAIKHRFLGAATPEGSKDFVQDITKDIEKRYFIKGRPGSGKSTMMRKIAKYAMDMGFDIEMYHCGFDANSIDMVIVPNLSVCIFDSTSPHEHFPTLSSDETVDVYKEAINADTDDKYSAELTEISSRYRTAITLATAHLKTMHAIDQEINAIYNIFSKLTAEEVLFML